MGPGVGMIGASLKEQARRTIVRTTRSFFAIVKTAKAGGEKDPAPCLFGTID